jgi:hypothetical protein
MVDAQDYSVYAVFPFTPAAKPIANVTLIHYMTTFHTTETTANGLDSWRNMQRDERFVGIGGASSATIPRVFSTSTHVLATMVTSSDRHCDGL